MIGALAVALVQRPMVSLDVSKDRGLFRENSAGQIENIYSLKIINKTQQRQDYHLSLVDGDGFVLQGKTQLSLAPGKSSMCRCRWRCSANGPTKVPRQ